MRTEATVTASRAASVTLPADTQILITREFGAPRHLVFLASTLTLTEAGGRTTLTLLMQHTSRENRDRHLAYGDSLQEAMDRLEQAAVAAG
jgi:uncharacterized protein YndB with AHSA1/START domain